MVGELWWQVRWQVEIRMMVASRNQNDLSPEIRLPNGGKGHTKEVPGVLLLSHGGGAGDPFIGIRQMETIRLEGKEKSRPVQVRAEFKATSDKLRELERAALAVARRDRLHAAGELEAVGWHGEI